MVRRMVVGRVCVVAAACADAGRSPTSPSVAALRVTAAGTVTIRRGVGSGGPSAVLSAAASAEAPAGVALSRVAGPGGGAAGGRGGSGSGAVLPLAAVRDGARGLLRPTAGYRRVITLRDEAGRTHHLVALYDAQGGPPRVIQHYVGRQLVRLTAMRWERVAGGWVQRQVLAREIRGDSLLLEAKSVATSLEVAQRAGGVRPTVRGGVLARLAAALAYTLVPADALAQYYFSECWSKYKEYWKATAALTSAILAIEAGAESGVGAAAMNALYFAYTAALAWATIAEMELFMCVENARERSSSVFRSGDPYSGQSGIGGGDGSGQIDGSCLEGSYAAHCQTPSAL